MSKLTTIRLDSVGTDSVPQPVCFGLPLPQGLVKDLQTLALFSQGEQVPAQWEPLLYWPDRSLKWVLCDFIANGKTDYHLGLVSNSPPPQGLKLKQTPASFLIENGPFLFELPLGSPWLKALSYKKRLLFPSLGGWKLLSARGTPARLEVNQIEIEAQGPVRVTIGIKGHFILRKDDLKLWFYERLSFFSGLPLIKVEVTLCNPRRAKHKGGFWDLGDPGSMYFRDFSFIIPCPGFREARLAPEPKAPWQSLKGPFELYQESSGGKNWNSRNHVNRKGVVPFTFKGYRLKISPESVSYGQRATPSLKVITNQGEVALALEHFWQNFPKALEWTGEEIALRLFPKQFPDLYELQGGEQKTHVFWLAFGAGGHPTPALDFVFEPARPLLVSDYVAKTKVLFYFAPADEDHPLYREMTEAAIKGPNSFVNKREIIDEYGWRNFGDLYADHENTFNKGNEPLISHYNNQYDVVYSTLIRFLRSEEPRWFKVGAELARHVYDIDIYHTDEDKPAYNHGLFWHTFHYVDAHRSTHRCYSQDAGTTGGGPSNEHLYSSGLLLHYLLTGDSRSREAVIKFGNHVIEMDKPYKILRWLDKGPSGLASQTRDPWYHGPGRGAGNSINCLLDAYVLTREKKYLAKTEELIRRCIHPKDDLEALGLRQPEERWSYTVFLQVLGKYLLLKAEWQEFDYMFAYARASLLHYARWMAKNEYIYLDKPELLEYPTETWVAQEIRKAEVFNLAAYFSNSQEERRLFREKACFFYEESLRRLRSFPTWAYTRPLAIILQSGFSYAWFQANQPPTWPEGNYDFGEPQPFVPQKLRVKQKLLRLFPFLPRILL